MSQTYSPLEKKHLENCTIGELLQVLASNEVLPGAGTAAGIALALGSCCAGKAVAITLGHEGLNAETSLALEKLQTQFSVLSDDALSLARSDALQFKRQLEAGDNQDEKKALIATDRKIQDVYGKLTTLLKENEHLIAGNVKGDWLAAGALGRACQEINATNLQEMTSTSKEAN